MRSYTARPIGAALVLAALVPAELVLATPASRPARAAPIQFMGWTEPDSQSGSGVHLYNWDLSFHGQEWLSLANGRETPTYADFAPSTVWAPNTLVTGETNTMNLSRTWSFGTARSRADIGIGAAGAVSPAQVHSFSASGGAPAGYGIYSWARQRGTFNFSGVSAAAPLYWGVEWTLTFSNPTATRNVDLDVRTSVGGQEHILFRQLDIRDTALSQSGSLFGSYAGFDFNGPNVLGFAAIATLTPRLGGNGADAGYSFVQRIAFSDLPFTDIPDAVADAGVPLPSALALVAVGLALIGTGGRIRARRQ